MTQTQPPPAPRQWPADRQPALLSPEPPVAAFDHKRLAAMAADMLATRREDLPAKVAAGELSQTEADLEIQAFEMLAANWRFIASGQGQPAGYGADHYLRGALDDAIAKVADYVDRTGNFSKSLGAKAESAIALAWHLEPGRQTLALARLNHQLSIDRDLCKAPRKMEPAQ